MTGYLAPTVGNVPSANILTQSSRPKISTTVGVSPSQPALKQEASPPVQTKTNPSATDAFNAYIKTVGPKNGDAFLKAMEVAWNTRATAEDYKDFYLAAKSFSLKKAEFEREYEKSLTKGEKKMKDLGIEADKIDNSRPRKEFKKMHDKIKPRMEFIFWSQGISDQTLTWSNWCRIARVEEFLTSIKTSNKKIVPGIPEAFYQSPYWMVADFEYNISEQLRRFLIVEALLNKTGGFLTMNERGEVLEVDQKGLKAVLDSEAGRLANENVDLNMVSDTNLATTSSILISQVVIIMDARKILQSRDFRIAKSKSKQSDRASQELCEKVINATAELMVRYIKLRNFCLGLSGKDFPLDLNVGTAFTNEYYTAYNFCHSLIRTYKRLMFGGTGGPDTRSVALAAHNEMITIDDTHGFDNNAKPRMNTTRVSTISTL